MHIEHFNISAPKDLLVQLRDFYCVVFDLIEGFRPEFSRSGYWLYADDKALVHLTESDLHFRAEGPVYFDHITFQFTGLKKLISTLDCLGVEYSSEHLSEIGMTQIFFNDPAGTGLEANFLNESID